MNTKVGGFTPFIAPKRTEGQGPVVGQAPVKETARVEAPKVHGHARNDAMDRGVQNPEHKMDVVCPVLGSLVASGKVKMDENGNIKMRQLSSVLSEQMGMSKTMTAALMGAGVLMANRPGDILGNIFNYSINIKELRGGMIKHPADSAILTGGKFDQKRFDELVKHAEPGGRMTIESFASAIKASAARDANPDTVVKDTIPSTFGPLIPDKIDAYARGAPSAMLEFAAVLNVFGTKDPVSGERFIETETLRKLYQDKTLPPDVRMQSRDKTGMIDITTTMSQMAWHMTFGSAAGTAQAGADKALGLDQKPEGPVFGAGKAICPHMGGAKTTDKPKTEKELTQAHSI